ncbi:hypothetical protein [Halorubellus litoreus]|uniref:Uncharacterized protein n=1 Tax=Halorubellus litoreus TaxID=755308 RepID=A0ABD5VNR3_9EURY
MDSHRQYELSTFDEPPSRADHPTPLLPLLYARHYWRTAARRCRRWLRAHTGPDHVAGHPFRGDDDTILLTGPSTPGKSLVDGFQTVDADSVEDLQPRGDLSLLRARYELERAADATRQRADAVGDSARKVARPVVEAIRAGPFGRDDE